MNKIMNEYLKKVNNEDENLNAIKSKIIKQKPKKLKLINVAAAILVIALLANFSPQIYAKMQENIKFKEYTRRNYVSGKGQIASAYNEKIDMEYVFQNNIGVKVDSILLTDDSFKANINLKLPEELRVDLLEENKDTTIFYTFGYAVYDEKNNIYDVSNRIDEVALTEGLGNYRMCLYKELGIKHPKYNLFSIQLSNSGGIHPIEKDNEKIVCQLELHSLDGFPNSEKLYIRIFNIGYTMTPNRGEKPIFSEHNELEWSFEIETPDKFLKREATNLKLLDEIPKLKIELFDVTETGMTLRAKKKDVVETMGAGKDMDNWGEVSDALINITDTEGNIYYPVQGGTTGEKNEFYSRFEIDKDLFESTTLYFNMKIGENEYTSEIVVEE